jgi:hypothetical protein
MEDPSKKATDVEEMPIQELRARTREVHRLLRAAREDVRASLASHVPASTEACIARLHAVFGKVSELLPGLVVAGLDAANGDPAAPASIRLPAPKDDAAPDSLTPAEVLRARRLMGELREGMERMDLLASIGSGIDELLEMIEASREELRRQAEDALPTE